MTSTDRPVALDRIAAVLCDMDGTLVNSDAAVDRCWDRWCELTGTPRERVRPIAPGLTSRATIRQLFPDMGEAELDRSAQLQLELQYGDLADTVVAVGAHRLIEVMTERGMPWAVVTSADRRLAEVRLRAAGIVAPLLVTSEDTALGKPSPDCYLFAADKLGVDPTRCLVIEDAAAGVEAGQAAGAAVAGLRGVGGDLPIPDLGYLAQLFASRP
ncbi:MAG TPA: HAD-IA family hydrolase [Mycobacteriales bacterium]|nr:HAD-IA family hydrolase [Mycobacteriales bacterium]